MSNRKTKQPAPDWSDPSLSEDLLGSLPAVYLPKTLAHPNCPRAVYVSNAAINDFPDIVLAAPYMDLLSLEDPAFFLTLYYQLQYSVISRQYKQGQDRKHELALQLVILDHIEPLFLAEFPDAADTAYEYRAARIAWGARQQTSYGLGGEREMDASLLQVRRRPGHEEIWKIALGASSDTGACALAISSARSAWGMLRIFDDLCDNEIIFRRVIDLVVPHLATGSPAPETSTGWIAVT